MDTKTFRRPMMMLKSNSKMSTSEIGVKSRQLFCRLCLAPENECVSIYNNVSADKQPLQQKISSCVQIKVQENDRLSPKICHACISFLNSWQSFKNRCDAAQRKQKSWSGLTTATANEQALIPGSSLLKVTANSSSGSGGGGGVGGNHLKPAMENAQQKFQQKQAELQKEKLQQLAKQQHLQDLKMKHLQLQLLNDQKSTAIDVSFIKSEPVDDTDVTNNMDEDEAENVQMEIDPSQFLARSEDEIDDDESNADDDEDDEDVNGLNDNNGPPILTSLGLTHINSVNPFSYMNNDHDYQGDDSMNDDKISVGTMNGTSKQTPANCTVCNMQFSNRANARRHEKNIHGIQTVALSNNQYTKPMTSTPVAAASATTSSSLTNISRPMSSRPKTKAILYQNIDYNNPAKYRHLLTPSKLSFILRNLNFLEQAQDMTCHCCTKQYPSYKFFMGHMRKKYHSLPRNVCFKCLKQFDSKGQFIGHLKRKNCPNLYKLVMADDTIRKDVPCSNNRIPAKEILANRVYACKICDDTFRLKVDFRDHVYRVHTEVQKNRETPNASCINCNEIFTDSGVRRRHFNNLECIVYIVCNTCNEQFPSQAIYLEHVYQTHLNKDDDNAVQEKLEEPIDIEDVDDSIQTTAINPSRSAQSCPVCNKQYNNYYNVLRHMESKHPDQVPQVYQCSICSEGFSKQTYLRDHLIKVHNKDFSQRSGGSRPTKLPAYLCKECGGEFDTKSTWIEHQSQHLFYSCMFCDYINNERDEFENHLEEVHQNYNKAKIEPSMVFKHEKENTMDDDGEEEDDGEISDATDDGIGDEESMNTLNNADNANGTPVKRIKCRLCNKRLGSKTGFQKHMIKEHGMQGELVHCTLCPAEFANDKGLKVHLFRSHKIRESEYASVLPPDLLDPFTQQQRKLQQTEEQNKLMEENAGIKSYECNFCHIVYRSRDELGSHNKAVHALDYDADELEEFEISGKDHVVGDEGNAMESSRATSPIPVASTEELWYQCRCCTRSFNSSKKLTIHMHKHETNVEPNDFTCKDCGIKYASKKSLWVHRHKKHPRIPEPSPCDVCKKVLFDRTELMYHMNTHSDELYFDENLVASSSNIENNVDSFLDSHPLLSILDTTEMNKPDPKKMNDSFKQQQMQRQQQIQQRKRNAQSITLNEEGQQEYKCDMCEKSFAVANALQVHRGWHFRSPDGRKVTNPSQMWHPDQVPPSKIRRMGTTSTPPTNIGNRSSSSISLQPQQPPICPHCKTKFASHNNLRRHIIEVHKRHELEGEDKDGKSLNKMDRVGECVKCKLTFSTLSEWIEHKINDARESRSLTNYEWNCNICMNKKFTRKDRCMQHMLGHANDRKMDPAVIALHKAKLNSEANGDETSNQEYETSNNSASSEQEEQEEDQEEQEEDQDGDQEEAEDDDDEGDIYEVDDESEQSDTDVNVQDVEAGFPCQLCQVTFMSAIELKRHASEHFLNGGIDLVQDNYVNEGSDIEEAEDDEEDDYEQEEVIEDDGEIEIEDSSIIDGTNNEENSNSSNSNNTDTSSNSEPKPKTQQQTQQQQQQQHFAAVTLQSCKICGGQFENQAKVISCMSSHQTTSNWKCSECQLFFTNSKQLNAHEKLCH